MNKYKINTTMAFEEELQFIYEYIANQLQEPNIAKQNYKKIRDKILTLQYWPERHQNIFKSKFKNLRKLNRYCKNKTTCKKSKHLKNSSKRKWNCVLFCKRKN